MNVAKRWKIKFLFNVLLFWNSLHVLSVFFLCHSDFFLSWSLRSQVTWTTSGQLYQNRPMVSLCGETRRHLTVRVAAFPISALDWATFLCARIQIGPKVFAQAAQWDLANELFDFDCFNNTRIIVIKFKKKENTRCLEQVFFVQLIVTHELFWTRDVFKNTIVGLSEMRWKNKWIKIHETVFEKWRQLECYWVDVGWMTETPCSSFLVNFHNKNDLLILTLSLWQ